MAKSAKQVRTQAASRAPAASDVLDRWLDAEAHDLGRHKLILLTERADARPSLVGELRALVQGHYVAPEVTAKRIADLGAKKTAALLKEDLPISKRARSADVGEIVATEYASHGLGYQVPIRRLQWKDGREMALRGDDIVAFVSSGQPPKLRFLKGEAKSRAKLTASVIEAAAANLAGNKGRPSRHSVNFVAKRLRERGQDAVAALLEDALLRGFRGTDIEHLLFALCGNNPDGHLSDYLDKCKKLRRRCHAVGLLVSDHAEFVRELYGDLR